MSSYTAHHQTPRQDDDKKSLSLSLSVVNAHSFLHSLSTPMYCNVLYTLTTDYSTQ